MNGEYLLVLKEEFSKSVNFFNQAGLLIENLTTDCFMLYHTAVTLEAKIKNKYININKPNQKFTLEIIPTNSVLLNVSPRRIKIIISSLDNDKIWEYTPTDKDNKDKQQ